ncbi:glycosyltransferase [Rhodococcus hoagii]|nr:glycosyltransferase [Prescottella equi]
MRILFVVPDIHGGGAEFVAVQWAQWLVGRGHEPKFFLTHSSRTADLLPDGVDAVQSNVDGFCRKLVELQSVCRDFDPDVVVSLMPYWNLLNLLANRVLSRSRARVVVSGRNIETGLPNSNSIDSRVKRALTRRLLRRADAYIAISHPVAAEARALYGIPLDKVWVVPNPATGKMDGSRGVAGADRAARPDRCIDLAVPARHVPQKRPAIALEVARQLMDRGEVVRVNFFGDGPLRSTLTATAEELGVDTVFHGWVEEWFSACPPGAVVLLPSVTEGFGNVLVEAAAAGMVSVVSSRCIGSADACVPGVTAVLAAGDAVADYTEAVLEAREIEVAGIDGWLDRFSRDTSGRVLLQALGEGADR